MYKSKGGKDVCDYCVICLLVVARKVLCCVILDVLLLHIANEILPEYQRAFRDSKNTIGSSWFDVRILYSTDSVPSSNTPLVAFSVYVSIHVQGALAI